jgi:hypothetical protein
MLTKQRMLEIVDVIDSDLSLKESAKFYNEMSSEDLNFLKKFKSSVEFKEDPIGTLSIRANLENFCYELSLDKVIDDRTKIIDKILNQI